MAGLEFKDISASTSLSSANQSSAGPTSSGGIGYRDVTFNTMSGGTPNGIIFPPSKEETRNNLIIGLAVVAVVALFIVYRKK